MLGIIFQLLTEQLPSTNPMMQFLMKATTGGNLHVLNGLVTMFVLVLYSLAFVRRYRNTRDPDMDLRGLVYTNLDFWIGFTVIVGIFGTTLLSDPLTGLMRFFSDGDDIHSGLKFMFRYDVQWVVYQYYLMFALAGLAASLFIATYNGVFYYYIYKGSEGIRVNGEPTQHYKLFRGSASAFVAILLICFSIFPEGLLDAGLGLVSDQTVYDIVMKSDAP